MTDKFKAINALCPEATFGVRNNEVEWRDEKIKQPTDKEINDKVAELQADYDAKQYQRERLAEYPSIQELVVALYDADDKAEIDKKRAEIKKKYLKP